MSALPVLIVTKEGETLKSLPLEADVSIGRAEGNVIRLEDRAVSRQHALVRKTPEGVQIEKQSDFAPIRLNGVECTRAFLKEGDVIEIGPFRMKLDSKKEEKKPAPAPAPSTPIPNVEDVAAPETPVFAGIGDATIAIDEPAQIPEALPTDASMLTAEVPAENVIGDLAAQLGGEPMALPIEGDAQGAEKSTEDPGTNIFETPQGDPAAEQPLNIDFNLSDVGVLDQQAPVEITPSFDENAATRVVESLVEARLEIPEGLANVRTLDLDKPEIFIGRGRECDVILNDKKSSRKNSVIMRAGNRYVIKDLDSSNGTYVNEEVVKEKELSADDKIRIGEVEIRFVALDKDYEKNKDSFLPVDPGPSAAPFDAANPPPLESLIGSGPLPYAEPAAASIGAPVQTAPAARKGLGGIYDKYIKNFGSLQPVQKLLVVLSVGLFLSWYFEDELGLGDPPQTHQQQVAKTGPDGKRLVVTDYDRLPPEKKAQIDDAIRKATDYFRQMEFDKTIYEIQQRIYPILPEYAQAKEIEHLAKEGQRRKEAVAEEARKRDEEEKLKLRIAELEKETRALMEKKKYEEAKEVFSEILSLDPENTAVSDWKKEIEAWMEEQARIEQERLVQEEINKRAWDQYNEAFELHKSGKFREAIAGYKKIPEFGTSDESLLKKVKTMIETCQNSIQELREPHLARAKELEKEGDLTGAFKAYQAATEVDPQHPDGWAGMERIKDVLNERAKILYAEAVIAESYSDFKTAHSKFNEILKMAPEGSLYFQRAQRKLQSYLNFRQEEEEFSTE